jgi:hypothetical protein
LREDIRLARERCKEGSDYLARVRVVTKKPHESAFPMPWAPIGCRVGPNGGTIFHHVTEERWTRRQSSRLPV